jgi:hypothetical protein
MRNIVVGCNCYFCSGGLGLREWHETDEYKPWDYSVPKPSAEKENENGN